MPPRIACVFARSYRFRRTGWRSGGRAGSRFRGLQGHRNPTCGPDGTGCVREPIGARGIDALDANYCLVATNRGERTGAGVALAVRSTVPNADRLMRDRGGQVRRTSAFTFPAGDVVDPVFLA